MNRILARFLFPVALLLAAVTLWLVSINLAPGAAAVEADGAVTIPAQESNEPPSNEIGESPQLD
jgi:hypothetical protein